MKKTFGGDYKIGDEVLISELEGGEERKFTIVEITKNLVIIEDENGRIATLKQPPDTH